MTEVAHGYLVWLRSPNFGMTTADFVNAATYNMEERYTAYTKGSQTPSTPQTPSGTTVPPSGARIRLCIEADQRPAVCWTRWSGPTAGHILLYAGIHGK